MVFIGDSVGLFQMGQSRSECGRFDVVIVYSLLHGKSIRLAIGIACVNLNRLVEMLFANTMSMILTRENGVSVSMRRKTLDLTSMPCNGNNHLASIRWVAHSRGKSPLSPLKHRIGHPLCETPLAEPGSQRYPSLTIARHPLFRKPICVQSTTTDDKYPQHSCGLPSLRPAMQPAPATEYKKPGEATPLRVKSSSSNSGFTPLSDLLKIDHTQPVGLARPATLQAPFAGPDGNSS